MDRAAHDRLKWKCRRGLLELDLVLGRFVERNVSAMDEVELARLGELLELPDNDLWDILSGRSDLYAARLGDVVARLRAC
ncbi:MAG: succinate dehydrogenase assembly factor 2 [Burkholderiales bacterium]|jgi:antitoxin CptB